VNSTPEDSSIPSSPAVNLVDADLIYGSWEQTAGYSDGDGGLLLTPEKYTPTLGFDLADTYKPQLEGVRRFLISEGLKPERIYPLGKTKPVWHLRLSIQSDLLKALIRLEPFLIKKKKQSEAVIRYLRDEITGEQLVEVFNEAILAGTRSGYLRTLRMPYTHSQGVAKGREFLRSGPRKRWRASPNITNRVRARKQMGITMRDITEEAGVSRSTIYRGLTDEETKS
jgi:hypothetical protein